MDSKIVYKIIYWFFIILYTFVAIEVDTNSWLQYNAQTYI